ncbi:ABC transporter substrate-binding protein [Nocardioides sp. DS6]|uniref:ABC transporter substrate-binding protein n=1 Tax=Nocardioides eburneus TaxID=3231482 RepID=A0ABV3T0B3_9ACTN
MRFLRQTGVVGLAAATLVALAACGSGGSASDSAPATAPSDLVSKAKSEGQITLYGDANQDSLQKWTQGFTDKYGIKVQVLRLAGSQLFQRFAQEESAKQAQADVFSVTDYASLKQSADQGWLAKYTPKDAGLLPADLGEAGYFYPLQNTSNQTVVYNTEKLTPAEIQEVRSDPVAAVQDPKFKGRIGVNYPQSSQQAAAMWYQWTDGSQKSKYGWDAMKKIAANKPVFASSPDLINDVISGEIAVGVGITDSLAAPSVAQGAPIQWVYPDPTVTSAFGAGVVSNAPHPYAARLFLEWATTPEADNLYSKITQTKPINKQSKDSRTFLKESWYAEPKQAWGDFITDKTFLDATGSSGDYYDTWNKALGYSG